MYQINACMCIANDGVPPFEPAKRQLKKWLKGSLKVVFKLGLKGHIGTQYFGTVIFVKSHKVLKLVKMSQYLLNV